MPCRSNAGLPNESSQCGVHSFASGKNLEHFGLNQYQIRAGHGALVILAPHAPSLREVVLRTHIVAFATVLLLRTHIFLFALLRVH